MCDVPDISVIIPCFNSKLWLHKCVYSILQQDYINYELILLDDGSGDGSDAICDCLASIHNRILVVHQKNQGVSATRQHGLVMSRGSYIIHADPDDWVEPRMFATLFKVAEETGVDVILFDYTIERNSEKQHISQKPGTLSSDGIFMELLAGSIHGSCCNKLVKRETVLKYGVSFPVGINLCEDLTFNLQLYSHRIKTTYLAKSFYHYCQVNSESAISASTEQWMRMRLAIRKYCLDHLFPPYCDDVALAMERITWREVVLRGCINTKKDFRSEFCHFFALQQREKLQLYEKLSLYCAYHFSMFLSRYILRVGMHFCK